MSAPISISGWAEQQAQQLASRVAARSRDRRSHPSPSLHVHAYVLMNLLEDYAPPRMIMQVSKEGGLGKLARMVKAPQIGFFSVMP